MPTLGALRVTSVISSCPPLQCTFVHCALCTVCSTSCYHPCVLRHLQAQLSLLYKTYLKYQITSVAGSCNSKTYLRDLNPFFSKLEFNLKKNNTYPGYVPLRSDICLDSKPASLHTSKFQSRGFDLFFLDV